MNTTKATIPLTLCELGDATKFGIESFSPFCLKAHRALQVAGLEYDRVHGRPNSFREYNPAAQVPVLLVDGVPVADSTRILAKVEELVPGSFARDAEALLWEELADTTLSAFLVASRWADERNWPAVREAYFAGMPALLLSFVSGRVRSRVLAALRAREVWRVGAEVCWSRFDELLDTLEARAPQRGYWVGDRLSAADLGLFAQLRSFQTELTPWQRERIAAHPRLTSYIARIDEETSLGSIRPDRVDRRCGDARASRLKRDQLGTAAVSG